MSDCIKILYNIYYVPKMCIKAQNKVGKYKKKIEIKIKIG